MSDAIATNEIPTDVAIPTDAIIAMPDDDAKFDEMTAPAYLPRMELFTGSKQLCKAGKFPVNHYGIVIEKGRIKDMGEVVYAYPLSYRFKAMDFSDKKKVKASFDENSAEFKRMQLEAAKKQPEGVLSNFMAGIEWLIYVRDFGFVTYMLSSASALKQSPEIKAMAKKNLFCKHSSFWKEQGIYAWQCPQVSIHEGEFDLPTIALMNAEIIKFKAAKVEEHEKDLEDETVEVIDASASQRAH